MSGDEAIHAVVGEWVAKAEHDLLAAVHTLKLVDKCPTDTVVFHAQQCIEKYIKAVLTLHSLAFPRTHNLADLVALLPAGVLAEWPLSEQRRLTSYATVGRYPGSGPEPSLVETRAAVKIAKRVRRELRNLLPPACLRVRAARKT